MSPIPFIKGDSVRVKEGVKDPDNPTWNIEAWQGRIIDITVDKTPMILVAWDSLTLKSMPAPIIEQCEKEGLDWSRCYLYPSDVEPVHPRDSEKDVEQIHNKLLSDYCWVSLGDEGQRIQKVLAGVDPDNEMAVLRAWEVYLCDKLTFPFDAKIAELQERSRFRQGDTMHVQGITMVDDLYGLIVEVQHHRGRFDFPLADLEASETGSPNFQPLRDYRVWFANR